MSTGAGEQSPSEVPLVLPLRWRMRTRLPTLGEFLAPEGLLWPPVGGAVMVAEREEGEALAWVGPAPDLIFAEVDSDAELLQGARAAVESDAAALFFVGAQVQRAAIRQAQSWSRQVSVLNTASLSRSDVLTLAAQSTEELVRRRVYRQLLAYWRHEAATHIEALTRFDLPDDGAATLARPSMAPLSTILGAHVAGVLGLWWPAPAKASAILAVSPGALRRAKRRVPEGIVAATSAAAAPAKVLVVDDHPGAARVAVRAFEQAAQRTRANLQLTVASSAREARRLVEAGGAPDVAWVDVNLEVELAGVELVRWMRTAQAPTVVVGKSGGADASVVRALTRLGALSVWSGIDDAADHTAADALLAADDAAQIARLEAQMDRHAAAGLAAARHRQGALEARRIVRLLEDDLRALATPGVGDPAVRIEQLESAAARRALAQAAGNRSEAAVLLGVDRKRLARLLEE